MLKRLFLTAFLLAALSMSPANAQFTVRSQGAYKDKDGTAHRWYVNTAHTLIWDDKPFVPVGGMFQAKSWAAAATEADYESDVAALNLLKTHGVMDIYVQPAQGGITTVKRENIQRLVDYLDENGFTYGVSLNDGPREPLIGYVVRPGAFRQVVPPGGGDLRFTVPDSVSGVYFTVGTSGSDIREQGEATVEGDTLRVAAKADSDSALNDPSRQTVVLLVPERVYSPGNAVAGNEIGMRNLWEGFDAYRDNVITAFSGVRFGKGFRFLCDPLPTNTALTDTFARFIPSSDAFRSEWAAYLGKKYRSLPNIISSWGIMDPAIASFEDTAKLLPLWSGGKGVSHFYNTGTKERLRAEPVRSAFWSDLAAFKAESVRGYMNDLAVTLKRTVADVPVVYRNGNGGGWNELFAALPATHGFDGLGIVAYGRGSDLATRSAAYTLAQASESAKTVWLPVLGTADTPYNSGGKENIGYDSKISLTGSFDWLRESGAKGLFVSGVRIAAPSRTAFDLSTAPEQLDWLRDYATILDTTGMRTSIDSVGAKQAPSAMFYPRREMPDLSPTLLSTGARWWLPTSRAGQFYYFGTTGRAYGIDEPGTGLVYYLWNPKEKRRISINVPKTATSDKSASRVAWSDYAQGELKKQVLSLTIGPEPIFLLNYPIVPVPQEAYPEARLEAETLIKAAKAAKSQDAGKLSLNLNSVRYQKENPYPGLRETLSFLEQIKSHQRRYFWQDAEVPTGAHSFDEASEKSGASNGRVLRVDTRPDNSPATARYNVNFSDDAPRDVWVAMSPNALVSLRLDGRPLVNEATIPQKIGNLFADGSLVWTHFGSATIPRGTHVLEIRADGPALIDAILLCRDPFTPDGPNPPPVTP
ncbi:MAG: hypothetical protein H7145_18920 [Akkermansiaceae bacterium]|nr:hypothetical protein [Armatimonadota bacterium]